MKVDIKGSRSSTDSLQTRLGFSSNDRLIVKWLESFVQMVRRILLQGVHTLWSGNEKKPFAYSMFTVLLFTKPVPGVWSVREAPRKLGRNWVFREGVVLSEGLSLSPATVERNREVAFKKLAPWVSSRTCRVIGKLRYVQDCKAISCYTDCSLELNRNYKEDTWILFLYVWLYTL